MKFKEFLEKNFLIDTHCHLNDGVFDEDREELLKSEIFAVIDIGIDLKSSKKAIENAKNFKNKVYASVGIDPEIFIAGSELFNPDLDINAEFSQLEKLIEENSAEVIMIGETGMDNYWIQRNEELTDAERAESLDKQGKLFKRHIELAGKYDLPLTIHSRNAVDECINILQSANYPHAVFHSLTPNNDSNEEEFYRQVSSILEMGAMIGINGIITYKSADKIRNVYKRMWEEKGIQYSNAEELLSELYRIGFVLETDGPFLVPSNFTPSEKRRNEPAAVVKILEWLMENL